MRGRLLHSSSPISWPKASRLLATKNIFSAIHRLMCAQVFAETNAESRNRYTLNISRQTKEMLDSIKHTGQSYDGLIQDIVKYWDEGRRTGSKSEITREKRS